jgi:hypothetical protein
MKIIVRGKGGRGRLKKKWLEIIENDMKAVGICVWNIGNRNK